MNHWQILVICTLNIKWNNFSGFSCGKDTMGIIGNLFSIFATSVPSPGGRPELIDSLSTATSQSWSYHKPPGAQFAAPGTPLPAFWCSLAPMCRQHSSPRKLRHRHGSGECRTTLATNHGESGSSFSW